MRTRLTYANVAATLALVLSITGGAFAASRYLISSTRQISPRVLGELHGQAGSPGPPGAVGPEGRAGPEGHVGGDGAAGREGSPGPTGEPGSRGATGTPGATGKQGPPGPEGPAGKEGSPGKEGPAGREGPRGGEGPAGKQGPQGVPGPLLASLSGGQTLAGAFGGGGPVVANFDNALEASISFQFPLAANPSVTVLDPGGPPTASCPGSAAAPSAIAGHLCVYVGGGNEVDTAVTSTYGDDGKTDYRYGAVVYTYPTCKAPCHGDFWGTWAVTAP